MVDVDDPHLAPPRCAHNDRELVRRGLERRLPELGAEHRDRPVHMPALVDHDDLLRRDDGEVAPVGRPLEVGRSDLDRRAPNEPSVCLAQHDRAAAVVRERCGAAWDPTQVERPPRRRRADGRRSRRRRRRAIPTPRCTRSACRSSSLPSAATTDSCRASFQRTPPSGSNATSSFLSVAMT